jgi:FtsP/CotA-like multicopper oxidase with cupredoxin domain
MSPLSRRQLLAGALAGGTLAAAGAAGIWWTGRPPGAGGPSAVEPQILASADGLLQLTLDAAPTRVPMGGRQASVLAFNGTVPGPTLRLRPGDILRVRLANRLSAPTNLHVHGLHVSPTGIGDNPFVAIEPGDAFDYEFKLPADHPPGTYWYHPHHHGHAADQVAAGLYGAILVEDRDPLAVTRDRVLVVSDLSLDEAGHPAQVSAMEQMMGREGELVLVNGAVPTPVDGGPGLTRTLAHRQCLPLPVPGPVPGRTAHEPAGQGPGQVPMAHGRGPCRTATRRTGGTAGGCRRGILQPGVPPRGPGRDARHDGRPDGRFLPRRESPGPLRVR